jgi:hypothetical protein
MNPIRYRPPDALRWLEIGAGDVRRNAQRQGASIVRREGQRTIGKDLRQAAGAIVDIGRSALAELAGSQALATEYVLYDDRFEVVRAGNVRAVPYERVRDIRQNNDRATFILEQGSVTIRPAAYLVAGRVRVPLGWMRNGMEVPYDLLLDELAARCGIEIEHM